MSSAFDKNLLPEFESIKDSDEEILWIDTPVFLPYLFSGAGKSLYLIAFGIVWFVLATQFGKKAEENSTIFLVLGIIPLLQGLYAFAVKLLSYSNTAYGYSNKRVMMRTGFIGTDFKTIDYDKISDIEVNVNVIERVFNVGTVRFFSGRTKSEEDSISKLYDSWISINNPYEIFKMVKQTSVDIKTDFNYPNALRPESNPGYKTKYDRKE